MGQDPGQPGQELTADEGRPQERTPQQVRREIEQTRSELGDTVAELAVKADVKTQAHHALNDAKTAIADQATDVRDSLLSGKDHVAASAREALPESSGDAAQQLARRVRENRGAVIAAAAFAVGLLVGRGRRR